jgi:hypothetical protein
MHRGGAVRGVAHPNFRGKGYAKDLPHNLVNSFTKALADPDLLSMRKEVALLQVRIQELVGRLHTGEAGSLWSELQQAYRDYRKALNDHDDAAAGRALESLGNRFAQGADHEAAWNEIQKAIDDKARVASREWKRLVDLQQVITAEQAMALIGAIMTSVKDNVHDVGAQRAIADDLAKLLHSRRSGGSGG